MKNNLKRFLAVIALTGTGLTGYYFYVLDSPGTEGIYFIEPDTPYGSFRALLQHPGLKGKTLYVDFWHTGCKPCLVDFRAAPNLKKHFRPHQKNLAFLYIASDRSMPGEKFRWKRMVEKNNLKGYHYFVSKEFFLEQLWKKTVRVDSIPPRVPHYLIVDAQGKVVDDNAPRPGDQWVQAKLAAALAQ